MGIRYYKLMFIFIIGNFKYDRCNIWFFLKDFFLVIGWKRGNVVIIDVIIY